MKTAARPCAACRPREALLRHARGQQIDRRRRHDDREHRVRGEVRPGRPGDARRPEDRDRQRQGRQRAVRTGWTNFSGKNIAAVSTITSPRIAHQGGPITRSARTTMFQHPGKAGEAVVGGLHPRVGEVDGAGEGHQQDHEPARPARQKPRGVERVGRDHHVGEEVDDQVHQDPVDLWRVGLHVEMTRERAVDAVHHEGQRQPQRHARPVLLERFVEREHGQGSTDGGEKMDGKGRDPGVMARVMPGRSAVCNRNRVVA
jgi:hypothetical protein